MDEVVQARRQASIAQAAEARLLARAADLVADRIAERRQSGKRVSDADLPLREVALELGMAVRVSDRTIQARMGRAWSLVEHFPATLAAWEEGAIDPGHAWAIAHAGTGIRTPENRTRYEHLALAAAAEESPARFAPIARAIAASVDPDAFTEQVAAATAERTVRVYDLDDGLARLIADLPAPLAYAIHDRLTQMATTTP
ncbi:DUF222 domain-containing protein, partial [Microbacterium sp. 18062]|uniref:DUF222 domain-containing protein n=1 Tax=Microbacterium sp. 18062 TaxID=2681410 RepID=UPI001F1C5370